MAKRLSTRCRGILVLAGVRAVGKAVEASADRRNPNTSVPLDCEYCCVGRTECH